MNSRLILTVSAALLVGCQSSKNSSQTQYSPPPPAPTTAKEVSAPQTAGLEVLDGAEINLHKEELVVQKREVSNGGIMVRTVVKSEEVKHPVELRREEYVVERIPAGSAKDIEARSSKAFDPQEIYIPLMKEEPITGKRTLLTESITLGKRYETNRQVVSMPIRTEAVRVVKDPDLSDPKFASVPRRSNGNATLVSAAAGSSAGAETGADSSINIVKEELMVAKQERDAGGVYLQKIIETENASQPVELRREEYTIERKPASGEIASAEFAPRQIQVSLQREEPVAHTRNFLTETVRVRKQTQTDKQVVTGTVRQETAEIVPLPASSTSAQGSAPAAQSEESSSQEASTQADISRDDLLESHVRTSLERPYGTTAGYHHILVTANEGEVTLEGDVTSESEKNAITKRVKEMSGVRSVNNELRVVKASNRLNNR